MPVKRTSRRHSKKVTKTVKKTSHKNRRSQKGGKRVSKRKTGSHKRSSRRSQKGGKDGTLIVADNKNTNNNMILCAEDLEIAEKLKASGKYPQHLDTFNLIINLKTALRDHIYVLAPAETLTAIDNFQQNLTKLPGFPLVRKCAIKKNQTGLKL